MNKQQKLSRFFNALIILIISGILYGAYIFQFYEHEEPCPLCMLQRLGMIAVAICLLMNLKFGVHSDHYGLALLSSLLGGGIALRQIALHVCPDFPEFGTPVFGLSLYVWSFLTFTSTVFVISLLFIWYDKSKQELNVFHLNGFEKFAFYALSLVTLANVGTTLWQCGLGVCGD